MILQSGQFNEDMIPTVGFNMRKVTKGNVTIKVGNIWFYKHVYTLMVFKIGIIWSIVLQIVPVESLQTSLL